MCSENSHRDKGRSVFAHPRPHWSLLPANTPPGQQHCPARHPPTTGRPAPLLLPRSPAPRSLPAPHVLAKPSLTPWAAGGPWASSYKNSAMLPLEPRMLAAGLSGTHLQVGCVPEVGQGAAASWDPGHLL